MLNSIAHYPSQTPFSNERRGPLTVFRHNVVAIFRSLPRVKGHRRLTSLVNSAFLRVGCSPIAMTRMRGDHKMILDTRSQTESYALYSGDYDEDHIGLLRGLLEEGSVFIDVGANIGFYAVPLGKSAMELGGHVFAFEPLMENFRRLQENVRINQLESHVNLFNIGLSNETRAGRITLREDFLGGSETGNAAIEIDHADERGFPRREIQLRPLDSMLGAEISRVDLIKVDIEGHEDLFLLGASETIDTHRPIVMLEVNKEYYRRRGDVDLYKQIRLAIPANYHICVLDESSHGRDSAGIVRGAMLEVSDFDGCDEIDTAFLIPSEKLDNVARVLQGAARR